MASVPHLSGAQNRLIVGLPCTGNELPPGKVMNDFYVVSVHRSVCFIAASGNAKCPTQKPIVQNCFK